ncbi:helix-turn-helix domain-containing protein [Halostagnicola sp. A56]|uniref:helix-turn-helix domain-containing protein n=1 Tax=Halostagnicola sp. A56 TaxID=1495067 RepID=UPI001E3CF26E|nr:helix-turn-helix domain-containing protein [Halostagnicola sp. A56]
MAGLAAAAGFDDAGFVVELYERQSYDSKGVNCGEAMTAVSKIPLEPTVENGFLNPLPAMEVEVYDGIDADRHRTGAGTFPAADTYITDRNVVEQSWAEQLSEKGVDIHENQSITRTDFHEFTDEYDLVVDATGQPSLIGAAGAGLGSAGTAGASAAGSGGLTGTARTAVANWSATGRRFLRRGLAAIPWELLPIFKYSRYDDSDPLENETRATIYETVEAKPGCYLSELGEDAGVSLSTVRHHVQILEDEGLLTTAKVNGKRRYYLEETDAALQAALEEPAKRDVLEVLSTLERPNNSQLASALERDPSTITHHLSALEDDGLVIRERDGRSTVTELAPETKAALRKTEVSTLEDASGGATAD